jgi:exodeoxyribonuclease VII small subunit
MTKKKTETTGFETSLKELNKIVEQMEQGGLTLEESLTQFEKGIQLTKECQQALKSAEQKIQILVEKNGKTTLENYEEDE